MTALKTSPPPTYRWVLAALIAAVAVSAPVGWFAFWLVSG